MFVIAIIVLAAAIIGTAMFVIRKANQIETVVCDPGYELPDGVNIPGYTGGNQNCQPVEDNGTDADAATETEVDSVRFRNR